MAAPIGNDYKMKWKTPQERQEAFEAVCAHVSSGYSKNSFPLADWDTVERYLADFPEDFPTEKLSEAVRTGYFAWDKLGLQGTKGEVPGFNSTAWIFNMKNRFRDDWKDRSETVATNTNLNVETNAQAVAELSDEQLDKIQEIMKG